MTMTNTFFSSWWKTLSVFLDPTRKRFCALLVFCNDCIHGMFLYDVKYSIFKWICLSMSALKHLAVYLKTCVFCEFEILKAVNIVCFFLSVKAGHQYLSFSLSVLLCVSYLRAVKRRILLPLSCVLFILFMMQFSLFRESFPNGTFSFALTNFPTVGLLWFFPFHLQYIFKCKFSNVTACRF